MASGQKKIKIGKDGTIYVNDKVHKPKKKVSSSSSTSSPSPTPSSNSTDDSNLGCGCLFWLIVLVGFLVMTDTIPLDGLFSSGCFTDKQTIYTDWGVVLECKLGNDGSERYISDDYMCCIESKYKSKEKGDSFYFYIDIINNSDYSYTSEISWATRKREEGRDGFGEHSLSRCGSQSVSGETAQIYKETYIGTNTIGYECKNTSYYAVIETNDYFFVVDMVDDELLEEFLKSCKFSHL